MSLLGNYELIGLEADAKLCNSGKAYYGLFYILVLIKLNHFLGQVHFENLRISETTDLCELKKIFSVEVFVHLNSLLKNF